MPIFVLALPQMSSISSPESTDFFPSLSYFFSVLLSSLLVLSLVVPVGNQRRESMPGWQL